MENTAEREGENTVKKLSKHICVGILAHVDAGKTTLSEAMLYTAGAIRKLGRVDHQNAFLDTDAQEKARGITIFSKQAELDFEDLEIMLLDTPGHVDFSAEMERTLQVLDYAILVISGKEGVQGHTGTLWKLLQKYEIPVFLFINKMDLEGTDRRTVMEELKQGLSEGCVDFSHGLELEEQAAMCDEQLLEEFVDTGKVEALSIQRAVSERSLFPCYFGSALKLEGVREFLEGMRTYTKQRLYPEAFGARVYKITRDEQGNRLTHMKITGGCLKVKGLLGSGEKQEKVNQLRIYSGAKFRTADQAEAGSICAAAGLSHTYAGQGLGAEKDMGDMLLEPVLAYQVMLPPECDVHKTYLKMKELEEEDPQLHIAWNEQLKEIQIRIMGQVQLEVLKTLIQSRFGIEVDFGPGQISYKETIAEPVTGAGHFEPLRHYAEVHLLLEPGKRGSGLVFDSICSEDLLDRNWQRLILTHLAEKEHLGVLTGSPVSDLKITLLTGRAHLKHTEGGDFRQATYRAVRQGLRKARSILLEPWYEFHLEVPTEAVGRAMSDIQKMGGTFDTPVVQGQVSVLEGKAPVSEMKEYAIEVTSYTKGHGRLSCTVSGYEPCHNQEEAMDALAYDPDSDVENTADSVFCDHGAGFTVKWDQVDQYLHMDSGWQPQGWEEKQRVQIHGGNVRSARGFAEDKELEQIFEKTYGAPKDKKVIPKKTVIAAPEHKNAGLGKVLPEYLLVDGYNIIFAWDELKALAKVNLDAAREALLEVLSNYQGYRKCKMIVVFDAYKVKGGEQRQEKYDDLDVVYTKEAETADMYIERTTYEIGKKYFVKVATSDRLEQMIILGNGAFQMSAKELKAEIQQTDAEISAFLAEYNRKSNLENRNSIQLPKKDNRGKK